MQRVERLVESLLLGPEDPAWDSMLANFLTDTAASLRRAERRRARAAWEETRIAAVEKGDHLAHALTKPKDLPHPVFDLAAELRDLAAQH